MTALWLYVALQSVELYLLCVSQLGTSVTAEHDVRRENDRGHRYFQTDRYVVAAL